MISALLALVLVFPLLDQDCQMVNVGDVDDDDGSDGGAGGLLFLWLFKC